MKNKYYVKEGAIDMSEYKEVRKFLDENNVTDEQMSEMWKYMYSKNWKVKSLTDGGKDWPDLNGFAQKSLVKLYNEELAK